MIFEFCSNSSILLQFHTLLWTCTLLLEFGANDKNTTQMTNDWVEIIRPHFGEFFRSFVDVQLIQMRARHSHSIGVNFWSFWFVCIIVTFKPNGKASQPFRWLSFGMEWTNLNEIYQESSQYRPRHVDLFSFDSFKPSDATSWTIIRAQHKARSGYLKQRNKTDYAMEHKKKKKLKIQLWIIEWKSISWIWIGAEPSIVFKKLEAFKYKLLPYIDVSSPIILV